jgi:hypothetical protein
MTVASSTGRIGVVAVGHLEGENHQGEGRAGSAAEDCRHARHRKSDRSGVQAGENRLQDQSINAAKRRTDHHDRCGRTARRTRSDRYQPDGCLRQKQSEKKAENIIAVQNAADDPVTGAIDVYAGNDQGWRDIAHHADEQPAERRDENQQERRLAAQGLISSVEKGW